MVLCVRWYQAKLIDLSLLLPDEVRWVDDYHQVSLPTRLPVFPMHTTGTDTRTRPVLSGAHRRY
eukprot:2472850-Rhodomonas_salina.6